MNVRRCCSVFSHAQIAGTDHGAASNIGQHGRYCAHFRPASLSVRGDGGVSTSQSLSNEAGQLVDLIARFKLDDQAREMPSRPHQSSSKLRVVA